MSNWFRQLIASKISINITVHSGLDDVIKTTTPRITNDIVNIKKLNKSNVRFVQEEKIKYDGEKSTFWFSEMRKGGRWEFVSETLSHNKDEAMEKHILLLNRGSLAPVKVSTVLWEGLDKEETESWIALQSTIK